MSALFSREVIGEVGIRDRVTVEVQDEAEFDVGRVLQETGHCRADWSQTSAGRFEDCSPEGLFPQDRDRSARPSESGIYRSHAK
jgi:hypothetical protein